MSYDLNLYRTHGIPLTFEEIEKVMKTIPNINAQSSQFIYNQPASEASFFLDVEEPEEPEDDEEWFPSKPLGVIISVTIPYAFTSDLENVWPGLLAQIAEKLGLVIYDGQADEEVTPQALISQSYGMQSSSDQPPDISNFGQLDIPDKAKEFVRLYTANLYALRRKYENTPMRVPDLVLVSTLDYKPYTAVIWNDFEPLILPKKVDAVIYVIHNSGFLGLFKKTYRYIRVLDGTFTAGYSRALQEVNEPIPHYVLRVDQYPNIQASHKYFPDTDLPGWHNLGPMPPVHE